MAGMTTIIIREHHRRQRQEKTRNIRKRLSQQQLEGIQEISLMNWKKLIFLTFLCLIKEVRGPLKMKSKKMHARRR